MPPTQLHPPPPTHSLTHSLTYRPLQAIAGGRKLKGIESLQYVPGFNPYFGMPSLFTLPLIGGGANALSNAQAAAIYGPALANAIAIAQGDNGLLYGGAASAQANAGASSVFGPAVANGVALANGGNGLLGSGPADAAASAQASSIFGDAFANSAAVAVTPSAPARAASDSTTFSLTGDAHAQGASVAAGGNSHGITNIAQSTSTAVSNKGDKKSISKVSSTSKVTGGTAQVSSNASTAGFPVGR